MTIIVGTASWTDPTLIQCGRFYPPGCTSAEARLRYYASQFAMVEVDASYYAMPSAANSALWVQRTPAEFIFDIKAFRLFTGHQTEAKVFPKDLQSALPDTGKKNLYYKDLPSDLIDELWRRFHEALEPLRVAGKLGAVLFQFAPWMTRSPRDIAHVEECAARISPKLCAFEFRNKSWLDTTHREATLAMERERGIVHVVMDAPPDVSNRAHTVWAATSPALAIVRLHGRNAQTWSGAGSAAERFNYTYDDDELRELAGPIREIARAAGRTHVIFNNCYEDVAQRNARRLGEVLAGQA